MSKDRKLTFWHVALIVWILFIWIHSLMPGDTSSSESGFFLNLLRPVFETLGVRDVDTMHFLIRKGAHFSEYLVLGALATQALRPALTGAARRLGLLCAIWVGVPCIDETIQLFTPGRAGAVRDVLIDMSGFATGFLIVSLIHALTKRREGQPHA